MARQKKAGLDYFPLDTMFFKDPRIRRIIGRFGAEGALFYIYILCEAYYNSYFTEASEDFIEDAALDLNCSTEKIGLMLHYLLDKSLLDSKLFSTVKVLSSHGIQAQYQEIKKSLRRDIEVDGDSWILDESETEGFIKVRQSDLKSMKNGDKSGINSDKSGINPQSKVKESKVNEMKGKEIARARDAAVAAVMDAYRNKISPQMSERGRDELIGFVEVMGADCCIRAIDIALDAKNATWPYIRAILQTKQSQGVRCLADWDAAEFRREKAGKRRGSLTDIGKPDPEEARKDLERMDEYWRKLQGDTEHD